MARAGARGAKGAFSGARWWCQATETTGMVPFPRTGRRVDGWHAAASRSAGKQVDRLIAAIMPGEPEHGGAGAGGSVVKFSFHGGASRRSRRACRRI